MKTIKNATEIEGFRQCHIRDGAALARYFAWLEEQLENGVELNESQGADQLEKFRSYVLWQFILISVGYWDQKTSELELFRGLSFDTISSTGPNGGTCLTDLDLYTFAEVCVPSYYPLQTRSCWLCNNQERSGFASINLLPIFFSLISCISKIYLCDSGAQFLDGTTDVTRTWVSDSKTPALKLVTLKCHSISEFQLQKKKGPLLVFSKDILRLIVPSFQTERPVRFSQSHNICGGTDHLLSRRIYHVSPSPLRRKIHWQLKWLYSDSWARRALWQDGLGGNIRLAYQ